MYTHISMCFYWYLYLCSCTHTYTRRTYVCMSYIYIYVHHVFTYLYVSMLDDQAPMLTLFTAHWDPESPLRETRACDGDIPLNGCWILSFPDKMYTSVWYCIPVPFLVLIAATGKRDQRDALQCWAKHHLYCLSFGSWAAPVDNGNFWRGLMV